MKTIPLTMMALALLLSACGDSEVAKARQAFVAGCTSTGGPKALCHCVFDHYEKVYSPAQIRTMNQGVTPEDFGRRTLEAAQQCRR